MLLMFREKTWNPSENVDVYLLFSGGLYIDVFIFCFLEDSIFILLITIIVFISIFGLAIAIVITEHKNLFKNALKLILKPAADLRKEQQTINVQSYTILLS